jgi:carbonic anhydrase
MSLYLSTRYNATPARVSWDDYSFVLSPTEWPFGLVNIDGINYEAQAARLRAPSEHKLQGHRTPAELQIFHRLPGSNPPKIVAIAILFEETAEQVQNMDWIFSIPKNKGYFQIATDLEGFFSDMKPIVFYNGSLTQPPCTEGVTWGVSMGTAKISFAQLKALNSFLKEDKYFARGRGNNRATQLLNGRTLSLRSNCGISGSIQCARTGASAKTIPEEDGGQPDDGIVSI